MVSSLRKQVYSLISQSGAHHKNEVFSKIPAAFNASFITDFENDQFLLKVPEKCLNVNAEQSVDNSIKTLVSTGSFDKIEFRQYADSNYLTFSIGKDEFVKNVLSSTPTTASNIVKDTIIVEFSSPNIAKPFHMGHLRSTIVGQFVSNVLSDSFRVIRTNYLGDWGTQFGLVQAGLQSIKYDLNDPKENPLRIINEAYVRANQDAHLLAEGRRISSFLESNDSSPELDTWSKLRELTVKHLKETYNILNIEYDEYTWESQYAKGFSPILDQLKNLGLTKEINGQMVLVNGNRKMPLLKSDGTSLYLSRDILSALDRYHQHKCKSIKYVVDKSQEDHLDCLRRAVSALTGMDIVDHVKFGKIIGMSTRKGTSVFLADILDKATHLMAEQQGKSPNTRTSEFGATQTLAVSTLLVYLLKQRRTKDFTFDWDLALQSKGDTGVKLQYTHSRLCSLEEKCQLKIPTECWPNLIVETEALQLVKLIDRFEQVKALCEITLESSHLVNYSFKLCNQTSLCLKKLPIKGEAKDLGEQRLLLFHTARTTLRSVMQLLGLKPLTNM